MNITLTGRTALILAAGLWIGIAGHVAPGFAQDAEPAASAEAATEAPAGKPIALTKFTKKHVAKKKVASATHADRARAAKAKASEATSSDATPSDATAAAAAPADTSAPGAVADDARAALPAGIANANAQIASDPAPDPFAQARPAPASPLQADSLLKSVGAENHQDAAVTPEPGAQVVAADELNEIDRTAEPRPALTLASATLDPPAVATSTDDSTWDKTSLIGKVFIAFGGLLTMASAARMFMA